MKIELGFETVDEIVKESLKESVVEIQYRLEEDAYRVLGDRQDDVTLLRHLMAVLEYYMAPQEWDDFIGAGEPTTAPQCDDEEFLDSVNALNDDIEVTVYLDSDTVDILERTAKLDGRTPEEVARTLLCLEAAKVEIHD